MLPNFHSNPNTVPGLLSGVSDDDVDRVLLTIFGDRPAFLLGKSWGGKQAATFASNHPHLVQRLALVAPALQDPHVCAKLTMPMLLMWSKDDWITPYAGARVYQSHCSDLQFVPAERGGHRILNEYVQPLSDFLLS